MPPEESFDSFYRATRRQLLLQCLALTGDLRAAQTAVRDAYVAAWQHWRKVSRHDDPLAWVRPRAWQLAQRRHTARIWHRNKGMSEDHKTVLAALASLPVAQRRVLLLVDLGGLDLGQAARELAVTRDVARRNLSGAADGFAGATGAATEAARRERLASLGGLLDESALPHGSVIRRAGRKRRHAHTLVASAVAVVIALASGAFAYQPGAKPSVGLRLAGPATPSATADPASTAPTAGNLLDHDQIRRLGLGQEWQVSKTDNNTSGNGMNTVCQGSRFADPNGYSAIVRSFRSTGKPHRSAVQTVEVSRSEAQAREGFRTTVGWYAGCRVARLQVLDAYRVDNIGDEADVLMIRIWKRPVTTLSVAVARTGRVTTSTVGSTVGASPPRPEQITQSLADAVAMLCARSGSKDCAKRPTYRVVPPPPSGEERGILAVADLPPVGHIERPWVGTRPTSGRTNPSATTCDRADFAQAGAKRTRTRTYLIPHATVPTWFGLSETYGVFGSSRAARRFTSDMRAKVAGCEDRNLATKVSGTQYQPRERMELSSWDLRTEVTDDSAVRFRLGFVRVGRKVAQLTFAPGPRDDMSGSGFHSLLVRAGDRLRELH